MRCRGAEAAAIRELIAAGGTRDLAPVHALLANTDALAYTRTRAADEAEAAAACLAHLPPSPQAQSLLQLSTFAANRDY